MRIFSLEPLIGSGRLGVLNLARKSPDLAILSGIKLRDIGLYKELERFEHFQRVVRSIQREWPIN